MKAEPVFWTVQRKQKTVIDKREVAQSKYGGSTKVALKRSLLPKFKLVLVRSQESGLKRFHEWIEVRIIKRVTEGDVRLLPLTEFTVFNHHR